jgi:hypothetical protein
VGPTRPKARRHAASGSRQSYGSFRKMAAGRPISIGEFFASLGGAYVEFVGLSELTPSDRELKQLVVEKSRLLRHNCAGLRRI